MPRVCRPPVTVATEGVNEMNTIRPLPHRRKDRQQERTRQSEPGRVVYMTTALAYQLFPDDDDQELSEAKMGFLDHLDELRKRIIRSCIAIAVGMVVAFGFIDRLVAFVLAPTRRMLPPGTRLIYTSPGEAFGLYLLSILVVWFVQPKRQATNEIER